MSPHAPGADLGRPGFEMYRQAMMSAFRWRNPRLSRYLCDVRQLPLEMPACLEFRFHSPEATLLLADTLDQHAMWQCFFHETSRLAQQVWRFRSRRYPGLVHGTARNGDGQYARWCDVLACRQVQACRLLPAEQAELAAASPECSKCGRVPGHFEWVYYLSAPDTWRTLTGLAGWVGVCVPCREQVAFFVDRMN